MIVFSLIKLLICAKLEPKFIIEAVLCMQYLILLKESTYTNYPSLNRYILLLTCVTNQTVLDCALWFLSLYIPPCAVLVSPFQTNSMVDCVWTEEDEYKATRNR